MRFSCNGCRVLRKGCSEDCSIRPSLEWIKSPEAQSNATLFLAKFYGRAGLLNLLSAGPDHLRPSIFQSLLHEACGRIVNPISGSSGLISTGSWHQCEAAVEAVLSGLPITQISAESAVQCMSPVFKACDIRHVTKKNKEFPKVKSQARFKRSKPKPMRIQPNDLSPSRSSGSDPGSVESVEDTLAKPNNNIVGNLGLELTLGFQSAQSFEIPLNQEMYGPDESMSRFELTLGLPQVY